MSGFAAVDCLRQIPIVSNELNGRAIGDLLLVGKNRRAAETYFTAIQRLEWRTAWLLK
jgi:hypothetical protein